MTFASELTAFRNLLPCTSNEVAKACGISASAMSRYLSGQRTPAVNSKTVDRIASGIIELYRKYGVNSALTEEDVAIALNSNLAEDDVAAARFSHRMNLLMEAFDLRNAQIAKLAGVDASYISRIRRGERLPRERIYLARHCVAAVIMRLANDELTDTLTQLEGISIKDITAALTSASPRRAIMALLLDWLVGTSMLETQSRDVMRGISIIDSVDFDATLKTLEADTYWDSWCARQSGDDLATDSQSSAKEDSYSSQLFYGLEGSREAELSFIGNILASSQRGTVRMNSNLASSEIAEDKDFIYHHQSGLMRFLQSGGRIDIIHNLYRPFSEIAMGLEYWLPLYLTGRVRAYYMPTAPNSAVNTMLYSAESCALSAEDIGGQLETRRCHLIKHPSEVEHCRLKTKAVLQNAKPIFSIYLMDDAAQRRSYEEERAKRLAISTGLEVNNSRFERLRIVSYPDNCSVVALTSNPNARAVIYHPRINSIIAHLGSMLENEDIDNTAKLFGSENIYLK